MRDLAKSDSGIIERNAAAALSAGPWSVTFHRFTAPNLDADPHDYVSQAPYWWPDPKNPDGPYIRHDGKTNPDRFNYHREDIESMCAAVLALSMGAYFLNKPGCRERAQKVLSVWFLDPKTRMNPNANHAEMIRGVNTGRGAGIMGTASLIRVSQAVALLEAEAGLDSEISAGLRLWYAAFLKWLTTSRNGRSEKATSNNHATWWTAQTASHATFVQDEAARQMAWDRYRDYLVPTEIQPDGSCPREEERTRSLHYSSMNLDAFSLICRLAQSAGLDLWRFRTPKGVGVEKSFLYLAPYLVHPETWKREQITKFNTGGYYFPGLAGIALPSPGLLSLYDKLPREKTPWVQFLDLLVRSARP